jgi:hypothetical protein
VVDSDKVSGAKDVVHLFLSELWQPRHQEALSAALLCYLDDFKRKPSLFILQSYF